MLSKNLLTGIDIIYKSPNYHDDIEIGYLSEHTNDLKPNTCFICIKGSKTDSHELVQELTNDVVLIIATKQLDTDIPYVIVKDTLELTPILATRFYEHPSKKLNLIGVTGTDGKTTTALITKQLIDKFTPCAYIGTNGLKYLDYSLSTPLTTPKAITLNQYLASLVKENIDYASLEVSSQGLMTHRVDQLHFKVGIFTNLTHEHLDYHETIDNYFLAKAQLFKMLDKDAYAIINLDSPYADRLIKLTKAKVITYGKSLNSDYWITNIRPEFPHTYFDLIIRDKAYTNISLSLFGDYNVYNAVASLACLDCLGFDLNEVIPHLRQIANIEGRMVNIDYGQPFKVIVDFAHTPYALESILKNLKTLKMNKLTLVFGCAGERDKSKRPIMGKIASTYADKIIITSEDPKSEDLLIIIRDIILGIDDIFKVAIIPNRKEAIRKAIEEAEENEIILITGKGNEHYEVFNGYKVEHNDIEEASNTLLFLQSQLTPYII
ncbi:MAG: UDP-N-acetylmuramoyl-L-alanyl-D-glutamate--2,6-diaminopimelate ligase [Bacilli bacterium]|nr:UDP-N-acetylmuramoyl-L-alanyl-D-glutamate--2,6-diaminopimelate ligase [Bacilli bacterium]